MKTSPCPPLNILLNPLRRQEVEEHAVGCPECRELLRMAPAIPEMSSDEIVLTQYLTAASIVTILEGWRFGILTKCLVTAHPDILNSMLRARLTHDLGLFELTAQLRRMSLDRANWMIEGSVSMAIHILESDQSDESAMAVPSIKKFEKLIKKYRDGPCYVQRADRDRLFSRKEKEESDG